MSPQTTSIARGWGTALRVAGACLGAACTVILVSLSGFNLQIAAILAREPLIVVLAGAVFGYHLVASIPKRDVEGLLVLVLLANGGALLALVNLGLGTPAHPGLDESASRVAGAELIAGLLLASIKAVRAWREAGAQRKQARGAPSMTAP